MIPGSANPLLLAGAEEAAFKIDRSLRFDDVSNGHLRRTPSTAGNRKTWTLSFWIKRTEIGGTQYIFNAGNTSNGDHSVMRINSDQLQMYQYGHGGDTTAWSGGNGSQLRLDAVFRDPSSWMHIVVAMDTTQATQSDRLKYYVNGVEQTNFSSTSYPVQNSNPGYWNAADMHCIGGIVQNTNPSGQSDYYLADVHLIDGQQLAASDFGEYDDNNVWQPKAYSGTYGTNGFHLDFSDNSSNAALGYDAAGSNDWTVNNLQAVTPSASYDSSYGSDITSTEAAKIFDSDDSTYGVATGDFIGFVYGGTAVRMKVENTSGSQVDFYIQPNVSSNPENSGTWSNQSAGTVSVNRWFIPANTTATAIFTFPGTWDGNGRIYTSNQYANLRFYSMNTSGVDSAAVDSLIDTPTDYEAASGNNGGNYCTLNPLHVLSTSSSFANGNLEATVYGSSSRTRQAFSTINPSSGKFYFEVTPTTVNTTMVGLFSPTSDSDVGTSRLAIYRSDRYIFKDGSNVGQVASTYAANDVIGVAYDIEGSEVKFYKNGTLDYTISSFTKSLANAIPGFGCDSSLSSTFTTAAVNFGQRPFTHTPPTGYKSLCTTNLADPTIADGSQEMDIQLWTGTGSGGGSDQTITGYNFAPQFVWIKNRTATSEHHALFDQIRGATKVLYSSLAYAEATQADGLKSFTSDGFELGLDGKVNGNNQAIVGWAWDAGTSTVSNTDGSITSSVRANASAGFSIVSYTGNGTSPSTIGHGLNAAPDLILLKNRSSVQNWAVYHTGLIDGSTVRYLRLNTTDAQITGSGHWQNTVPTSSVFTVGNDNQVNANGNTYIAYCFAPVEGYSAFGSYEGNNLSDGVFIYTGFRPKWIMVKKSSASGTDWLIEDATRSPYNPTNERLRANTTDGESANIGYDFTANGFKIRSNSTALNASGSTYIYACFAEHPFKTARAR